MKIQLPEKVSYIISVLNENGYEAFAVGGCVRDSLLDRIPKDWDITTNALPEQIKSCFAKTVDTGIKHGTVTVVLGHEGFEVTTYRIDGAYSDGRHPDEVSFTGNLKEDLARRDFTINAMAYNDQSGLVDEYDGADDLKAGIIRCVGDPVQRFDEDGLRILRAVRFCAQLGFEAEENTLKTAGILAYKLTAVSAERIRAEIEKTILSPYPEKLITAFETGLTDYFLNEIDCGTSAVKACGRLKEMRRLKDLGDLSVSTVDKENEAGLAWGLLLSDISVAEAKKCFKRLKFDNVTARTALDIIGAGKLEPPKKDDISIREYARSVKVDKMPYVMAAACVKEQYAKQTGEDFWDAKDILKRYLELRSLHQCMQIKELAIDGNDLIAAGIPKGKQLGELMEELLTAVIREPECNDREKLLAIVGSFLPSFK